MSTNETTEPTADDLKNKLDEISGGETGHPMKGIEVPADGKIREFDLTESENKTGPLPPIDEKFYAEDSIPLPEAEILKDTCLMCGDPVPPGSNFCKKTEEKNCEIDYQFAGVSVGVKNRYIEQMKIIANYKTRKARSD